MTKLKDWLAMTFCFGSHLYSSKGHFLCFHIPGVGWTNIWKYSNNPFGLEEEDYD